MNHNLDSGSISNFYQNYVTNYQDKIANASSNLIKYYSYNRDEQFITNKKQQLDLATRESNILNRTVNRSINQPGTTNLGTIVSGTGGINSDADFTQLSQQIWAIINYLNGTELPVWLNLMNKINIPSDLSNFFNVLLSPNPEIMNRILSDNIKFDVDDNLLPSTNFTSSQLYDLIIGLVPYYIRGAQLASNYSTSNYATDATINNQAFITSAQDQLNNLITDKSNVNLRTLFDTLTNTVKPTISNDLVIAYISDQLQKIYDSRYGDNRSRIEFQNHILQDLDTVVISIYDLFYNKLSYLYYLVNGLILINNPRNPNYSQIQKDQHTLSNLRINIRRLHLTDNYNQVLGTNRILTPIITTNIPPTGRANPIIGATFTNNNHNSMNCQHVLIIVNQANPLLNTIITNYQRFYANARPIISLMRESIIDGNTINLLTGVNRQQFKLLNASQPLLPSSFSYTTSIVETNDIVDPLTNPTNTLDITNNPTNNPLGNIVYNYGGTTLRAYIPSYEDDTLGINGLAIEYTNNRGYYINIRDIDINAILIANGSPLSTDNINETDRMSVIGNYLVDFVGKLYTVSQYIPNLYVENVATWGSNIQTDNMVYTIRISKKSNLLKCLNTLHYIEQTIRTTNELNIFDNLLLESTFPSNSTLILSAISIVQSQNILSDVFNEIVDKIWIFARKLTCVWYTVYSHMLTSFILNNNVGLISTIISSINPLMNRNQLFNLNDFDTSINNINQHVQTVNNEIRTRQSQIDVQRAKYPIIINPAKNSTNPALNKYIIDDASRNLVKFHNYYTNIGKKSSSVYVLLALTNGHGNRTINNQLLEIANQTDRFIDLATLSDDYLRADFVQHKITLIPTIGTTVAILVPEIDNFRDLFLSELQNNLRAIDLESLYSAIAREITDQTNLIKSGLTTPIVPPSLGLTLNRIVDVSGNFTRDVMENADTFNVPDYLYSYNEFRTSGNPSSFFGLYLTDIYKVVFKNVKQEMINTMQNINQALGIISVTDFGKIRECFETYTTGKTFQPVLFDDTAEPANTITDPPNANTNNIKAIILMPDSYQANKSQINDIDSVFHSVTDNVDPDLYKIYETENDNYGKLIETNSNINKFLSEFKNDILNKIEKLRNISTTINQVMFNDYFKRYAFVNNAQLMESLETIINNYETIWTMIEQKIVDIINKNNYHVLTLSQINNYQAFKSAINKLIDNKAIVNKFYKRMSFGLIEYYYDIMDTILACLESKNFEDMSDLEAYLYQYHYIQIKRCHALFKWIRQEYQREKQAQDDINIQALSPGTPYQRILKFKIEPTNTLGDVNSVFLEFQGLRRFLDEYSAIAMDKVQLHLRINDFVYKSYNDELVASANGRNVDFMLDEDPFKDSYVQKWDDGDLVFINDKNGNNLKINFDLLQQIYEYNNPTSLPRNFDAYYTATYRRMKPTARGIDFQRIYNTRTFPDSDVISNYMSIAPNILNNKGTIIMTYGYSGVGKSASLFGRKMDISRGIDSPSNGILQATLEQLTNVEIYFRVFEIYGLGTQYNYYWNPTTNNNYQCYPDFYQCIIHHVIDTSNPTSLRTSDQLVFTNKHDMLAYIMDLQNPKTGTHFHCYK